MNRRSGGGGNDSSDSLNFDGQVIDIDPPVQRRRGRRRWLLWMVLALLALYFSFSRLLGIYVEALWFDSLGYASVYWYGLRLQLGLFAVFAVATIVILRSAFWMLERIFAASALQSRLIIINNQPVRVSPAGLMKPLAWTVAVLFGIGYGFLMSSRWLLFTLFFNRSLTSEIDPIFNRPVDFYLFTLPVYGTLAAWLTVLGFLVLGGAVLYAALSLLQDAESSGAAAMKVASRRAFAAVSGALAGVMLALAWRIYLSRFSYVWQDHEIFSGVTYTEANYVLPGLLIVAVTLVIAAVLLLINAFARRTLRLLLVAVGVPVAVYVVAVILVPGYITGFIVKPNELDRETPYIEHNIRWTRRGFDLEQIEVRDFAAEAATESFNLEQNQATLNNLRLWDWRALQDTLRQMQEIRTYYDFPDVDVDRYTVNGETRQVMVAAREMDIEKLPASSRNWINERLIYTHGYGVTMNTANGFTPDGRPLFLLSNMPIEAASAEFQVTRPQIYFGQRTNTDVYVNTKQKEFDFPQGEDNAVTTYEGTGGIPIGGYGRRVLLAWQLDDLSKLPFSDDVLAESRVLMHRNITERVNRLAPFLIYDDDPYIVVTDDGRLHWMMDAFTLSNQYPLSRHYDAAGYRVNYLRNSVKVTIDAYNGQVRFYVFDTADPLIASYRSAFPDLFRDAGEMPADLRGHVRYPETMIKAQADVYGLYHTQNAKTFFQREDVWSVAREIGPGDNRTQQASPLEPYYMQLQLPGSSASGEFVSVMAFTPANRNNLIGWMAGRQGGSETQNQRDGETQNQRGSEIQGSLLIYNFPKSRLIDGPLQIEARIDQNAQLSSQLTLWNQQGSHVQRGNLLVVPLSRGLLYVEPIYLQAERSPMPELRLVVLATQERLGYGTNFAEALQSLFGLTAATTPDASTTRHQPASPPDEAQPASTPALPPTTQALISRAAEELSAYQRLTAEGKLGEAGQQLERLKRTLEELNR